MNSRERVMMALNHKEPDKVPIDFGGFDTTIEADAYEDLKKYLGIKKETIIIVRAHTAVDEEILEMFSIIDAWGAKWYRPESSYYFDPVGHPLANYTYDDLKDYHYPDLWDKSYENELLKKAENLHKNNHVARGHPSLRLGLPSPSSQRMQPSPQGLGGAGG